MSIVLFIIKIIGIVLLVVLGLILLTALAVLFVPIHYRVTGSAETADSISVRVRVSWLLRCLSYRGKLEKKEYIQKIRIFGIPLRQKAEADENIKPGKKRPTKKRRSKKERKKKVPRQEQGQVQKRLSEQEPEQERAKKPQQVTTRVEQSRPEDKLILDNTLIPEEKPILEDDSEQNGKLQQLWQKITSVFFVIKSLPGMIKSKLEKLKEKMFNFRETAVRIKQEIQNETNRAAVALLFRELKYLLRHISPRKVKADISFGMEDPATTGQILGAISILPFVYRYQIQIFPEFAAEEFYFKGTFDIKGYIRGIHVLVTGYHLLKDKNIRSLIQRYRNS